MPEDLALLSLRVMSVLFSAFSIDYHRIMRMFRHRCVSSILGMCLHTFAVVRSSIPQGLVYPEQFGQTRTWLLV